MHMNAAQSTKSLKRRQRPVFARLLALLLWPVALLLLSGKCLATPEAYPFQPGEKMTFKLSWGIIPAGTATLEVLPMASVNGQAAYHFLLTARSNKFIDTFYKVRDRIEGYADITMTSSLLYRKIQCEGRTRRNVRITFDWDKMQAQYIRTDKRKAPVAIQQGCFDPLSVFYYMRLLDLKKNGVIERPITDGKRSVIGKTKVVKRQTIKVPGGTYDTFLLEPDLKDVRGVFEKSKESTIKLWVTADQRRLLVKIESKVAVGSFVGELISYEKGVVPASKPVSAQTGD